MRLALLVRGCVTLTILSTLSGLHLRPYLFSENFHEKFFLGGGGAGGVHYFSVKHKTSAPSTVLLQHC